MKRDRDHFKGCLLGGVLMAIHRDIYQPVHLHI
jgi:hypothetical protein